MILTDLQYQRLFQFFYDKLIDFFDNEAVPIMDDKRMSNPKFFG